MSTFKTKSEKQNEWNRKEYNITASELLVLSQFYHSSFIFINTTNSKTLNGTNTPQF